jgi:serralysin
MVVTYSFINMSSQFGPADAVFGASKSEFSAQDKAMTREVLASFAAVCNLTFVEVADPGPQGGSIRFGYSAEPTTMGIYGYSFEGSGTGVNGDVWIGQAQAGREWEYARKHFIAHETGHILGLSHPFEGPHPLDTAQDLISNTIMSYSTVAGSVKGSMSSYPGAPMAMDIARLQEIYGAADFNAGNTVYDLSDAQFQTFRALWDSAGVDMLDASGSTGAVKLDLAPGARSEVGSWVQAFAYQGSGASQTFTMASYADTLAIAEGADIENAVGSAFDDVIFGNALDNVIHGGAGDDLIDGRGGRDSLFGGQGNDTLRIGMGAKTVDGGSGIDTVVFSGTAAEYKLVDDQGQVTVTRLANADDVSVLRNVEQIGFSDLGVAMPPAIVRFPAGAELVQRYADTSDFQFVANLYMDLLERTPDGAGLLYHVDRIQHGGVSRADVLAEFSGSPEYLVRMVGVAGFSSAEI